MPSDANEREVSDDPLKEAATRFLASKRIAVTGVSRSPKDHGANTVYRRLLDRGYERIWQASELTTPGPDSRDLLRFLEYRHG